MYIQQRDTLMIRNKTPTEKKVILYLFCSKIKVIENDCHLCFLVQVLSVFYDHILYGAYISILFESNTFSPF